MVDVVDPATRSRMMAGIKGKNTKPEFAVRKMLHGLGLRYRLHASALPGKPDLVFARFKAVIFVHGCFWHGHGNCALFRIPLSRSEFWTEKLEKNAKRDQVNIDKLLKSGWRVGVIWECALKGRLRANRDDLAAAVAAFIREKAHSFQEFRGVDLP